MPNKPIVRGNGDSISTAVYPYQITAGSGNPLNASGTVITSSNSIGVSPIYTTGAGASNNSVMLVPNGNNMARLTLLASCRCSFSRSIRTAVCSFMS